MSSLHISIPILQQQQQQPHPFPKKKKKKPTPFHYGWLIIHQSGKYKSQLCCGATLQNLNDFFLYKSNYIEKVSTTTTTLQILLLHLQIKLLNNLLHLKKNLP
jgi:hypothetical protein